MNGFVRFGNENERESLFELALSHLRHFFVWNIRLELVLAWKIVSSLCCAKNEHSYGLEYVEYFLSRHFY